MVANLPRTAGILGGHSSGVTISPTQQQQLVDFREHPGLRTSALDVGIAATGGETALMETQAPLEGQTLTLDQDKYSCDSYFNFDQISEYDENTLNNLGKISVKGRLKKNISFWESIHANKTVFETISHGYKIPFVETPVQAFFQNNKTALLHAEFVEKSINDLVDTGAVKECDSKPHVVSPLSVSINAKGKKRLILDLRYVNSHVYKDPIRFDDWRSFGNYLIADSFCFNPISPG